MESFAIVFLVISIFGLLGMIFSFISEFLQERNDYEFKINKLESEKFEMEHRIKNQSDIIKALMDWKEESKSVD